jgi:transcriptional regulator with XRE-family HTH domain
MGISLAREEKNKTALGQRLREVRRRLGDPEREDLCLRLGISKQSLANYERGDRVPDATVLLAYRSSLGVNINWLVSGDGNMFDSEAVALDGNSAQLLHDFKQLPEDRQLDIIDIVQITLKRVQHG